MADTVHIQHVSRSDGYFDILEGLALTLTSPLTGSYEGGDTVNVTWTRDNPDVEYIDPNFIKVELDRQNAGTFAETVVASVDADDLSTSFIITQTPGLNVDSEIRIRLVDLQTSNVLDTSGFLSVKGPPTKVTLRTPESVQDGYFDILEPMELSLTSPLTGDTYEGGDIINVIWVRDNPDVEFIDPNFIRVELDRNNQGTFTEVIEAIIDADVLSTSFTATPTPGINVDTQVKLRLVDLQTTNVLDTTGFFTIKGAPARVRLRGTFTVAG